MTDQSWFQIDLQKSPYWKTNLERFCERFPQQGEALIQASKELDRLEFCEVSPQKYTVRDSQEFNLFYESESFDAHLQQNYDRMLHMLNHGCELLIVAGSGLGYLAAHLESTYRRDYRRGLMLIENRPALTAAQFCLFNCRPLIDSNQLFWVFDSNMQYAFQQMVEEQRLYLLHPSKVCVAPERILNSGEQFEFKQLPALFASISQKHTPEAAKKRERYNQRMAQVPTLNQGRLWSATSPDAYAHTPLMKTLGQGFTDLGWEWRNIDIRDGFHTRYKVAEHLIESRPDLILVCNAPSSSTISPSVERPRIVWMLDHPNYYSHNQFDDLLTKWDHIFYTDRAYEPFFRNLPAGSVQHFTSGPSFTRKGKFRQEMSASIAFVGQYFPIGGLTNKCTSKQKEELLAVAERMIASPITGGIQAVQELGISNKVRQILEEHALEYTEPMHRTFPSLETKIDYYLYTLANNVKRERYVKPLLQFGIVLYGPLNWLQLLGEEYKSQFRGWLLPDDLPDAYASAAISLNIHSLQCPTSVNPRDFDILAAGGCLLSDHVEDMDHEIINSGSDFFSFENEDELVEKVECLLNDESLRHATCEQGHQTYLKRHTPKHRAEQIVNHLHKFYPEFV